MQAAQLRTWARHPCGRIATGRAWFPGDESYQLRLGRPFLAEVTPRKFPKRAPHTFEKILVSGSSWVPGGSVCAVQQPALEGAKGVMVMVVGGNQGRKMEVKRVFMLQRLPDRNPRGGLDVYLKDWATT